MSKKIIKKHYIIVIYLALLLTLFFREQELDFLNNIILVINFLEILFDWYNDIKKGALTHHI